MALGYCSDADVSSCILRWCQTLSNRLQWSAQPAASISLHLSAVRSIACKSDQRRELCGRNVAGAILVRCYGSCSICTTAGNCHVVKIDLEATRAILRG